METNQAVMAFSQSEKIKAGLIWVSQILEFTGGLPMEQRRGAEKSALALLRMVAQETALAKALTGHEDWTVSESYMEKAMVMLESGIGEESMLHIARALSKVTNVGQQAMSHLQEAGLL
jgi:hypothetical protein